MPFGMSLPQLAGVIQIESYLILCEPPEERIQVILMIVLPKRLEYSHLILSVIPGAFGHLIQPYAMLATLIIALRLLGAEEESYFVYSRASYTCRIRRSVRWVHWLHL